MYQIIFVLLTINLYAYYPASQSASKPTSPMTYINPEFHKQNSAGPTSREIKLNFEYPGFEYFLQNPFDREKKYFNFQLENPLSYSKLQFSNPNEGNRPHLGIELLNLNILLLNEYEGLCLGCPLPRERIFHQNVPPMDSLKIFYRQLFVVGVMVFLNEFLYPYNLHPTSQKSGRK